MPVRRITLLLLLAVTGAGIADEPTRPPTEVARELLEVYGKRLDDLTYIPALAVHCRGRFAELTREQKHADEVRALVAPYLDGDKTAKTDSHVAIAGHLALVGQSNKPATERIALAADRVPAPKPEEMSDAVFMCGPTLCEAGRLTKDDKYFEAAAAYLAELRKLRQRDDGLYAHGHLCDAAWGRGNGFAAVGVAWCLTALPAKHERRIKVLDSFRAHMEALLKHQDADGMWHQVIDVAKSKPEFTCTCMIGFAMQRGIAHGWLAKEKYQPAVDNAWRAIGQRIKPQGKLIGVCEGTGTQPTVEAYLGRKLNDGVDQRGGAMALLFATELMAANRLAQE
jgi:rhamnogalacturonyl hydrolase YesR